MFDKLKQIKELRDRAKQMKEILAQETVHADAAHGQVNIVMDGNQEIISLTVEPELLAADKKEELEQGIKEAVNEAIKKSRTVMAQKIQGMDGLNIPGL